MKDWLIEHKLAVIAVVFIVFGGLYYFYAHVAEDPVPMNTIDGEYNQKTEGT